MVLTDKGTSSWGWNQNALIQIDTKNIKVNYTPEYYAFKHFSYFIPAGSRKIECVGSFKNVTAFVNTRNEVVVVICNHENTPKTICVKIGNSCFTAVLQTKSFNTFAVKL
jgi:glucosylceramidase